MFLFSRESCEASARLREQFHVQQFLAKAEFAALHRPDGSRILSHTEAAAGPLRDGGLNVPLTWNGSPELPAGDTPLSLRLSLHGKPIVHAVYPA